MFEMLLPLQSTIYSSICVSHLLPSCTVRLDVQGTWFDETVKKGSIGSSSLDWDDEWDQYGPGDKKSKYTRAEQ